MSLKSLLQRHIRQCHLLVFDKGLPQQLGVYLHCLERQDHVRFREMVMFLRDNGYAFTSPDRFVATENQAVFLSFDDNYRSWWESLDLLDSLAVKATFYVNTKPLRDRATDADIADYFDRIEHRGQRQTLSTDEVRDVHGAGHTVGCHTHSHKMLTSLSFDEACTEIATCKNVLESILRTEIAHFSYPFGMRRHFNEPLREFCKKIGFRTVANTTLSDSQRRIPLEADG